VREKEIANGQFICPTGKGTRPYKHKRVGKYFALFFIALFKTKDLDEATLSLDSNGTPGVQLTAERSQVFLPLILGD
jgi:arginine/lysine/ornithine decarboxylase